MSLGYFADNIVSNNETLISSYYLQQIEMGEHIQELMNKAGVPVHVPRVLSNLVKRNKAMAQRTILEVKVFVHLFTTIVLVCN
jgi:hypothetical protein